MLDRGDHGRSRDPAAAGSALRPRVVILDDGRDARVEVLQLPPGAAPGARFCHRGAAWRVTGSRTGDRVLIAEPNES